MGFLDSILGRKKPARPDLDTLFALPSAAITLDVSLGFRPTGTGSVAFRAPEGRAFADVQAKAGGPVLELVLMSREAMGKGAPQTRQWFEQLALAVAETMPQLELVFRSDRDGPLPDGS